MHREHSRRVLKTVKQTPVLHNNVRGEDPQFDQCWEDTIHGRATQQVDEFEQTTDYDHANIQINSSGHNAGQGGIQPHDN